LFPGMWGLRLSAWVWDRAAVGFALAKSADRPSRRYRICEDPPLEGSGASGM